MSSAAPSCAATCSHRNRGIPTLCTCSQWQRGRATRKKRNDCSGRVSRARRGSRACVSISPTSCVRPIERAKPNRICAQRPRRPPSSFRAGTTSVFCCASLGRLDEADQCAARTNALSPAYAAGWELRAAIAQQRGDIAAAISACRTGLRHAPAAARLHYSLGQLLREDCRFAEAAQAYEAAQRLRFRHPRSLSQSRRGTSGGRPWRTGSRHSRRRRHSSLAGRIAAPVARRPALGNRRPRRSVGERLWQAARAHPQRRHAVAHTRGSAEETRPRRTSRTRRSTKRSVRAVRSRPISWCWKRFDSRASATSRKRLDSSTASSPNIRPAPDIVLRSWNI